MAVDGHFDHIAERLGTVVGDIAWGGNWFFLVGTPPLPLAMAHIQDLTRAADAIARALEMAGITGADGGKIDHVEFFGPPRDPAADSRNFVLCPGGAYDRSPCGTGTSALLATLAARGELAEAAPWVQESAIGSVFEARYAACVGGAVRPTIAGRAFVVADGSLVFDAADPSREGGWRESR